MSSPTRSTIKFVPFTIVSPHSGQASLNSPGPIVTWSRSSTPPSLRRQASLCSQTRDSEAQDDPSISSTSSNSSETGRSIAPCDEHACSRCRLTAEEARRLKAARRREQNRASQRRFRAKKENEIRGAADQVASLESMIQELQVHNMELGQTNLNLKARLAELEAQRAYEDSRHQSVATATVQCARCSKASTENTNVATDFFWSIDDIEFQQLESTRLGPYLSLFDHELLPIDI